MSEESPTTPPPDPQDRDERPQVAWKAIEGGAQVFSAEGEAVAHVAKIVGDADADVFTGLAVRVHAFEGERLLPAERVVGIWPDRVDVDLTKAEIENLPKHEDVPVVRWRPGRIGGVFSRLFGR